MMVKEFIQLKRDRLSFAHDHHGAADPARAVRLRHQHHAAPSADRGPDAGTERCRPLDAARAGEYAIFQDHAGARQRGRVRPLLASGRCCSPSKSPPVSSARCGAATARRSWSRPTRPIRWRRDRRSLALNGVCRPRCATTTGVPGDFTPPFEFRSHARYNPAGRPCAQHRARAGRHDPHHDHADLHRAVGHARDRARHHGEPAVDADHAGRDHARQDRALRHGRFLQAGLILGIGVLLFGVPLLGQPAVARRALDAVHHREPLRSATPSRRWRKTSYRRCRCRSCSFCRTSCCRASCSRSRGMPVWAQWIGEALPLTHYLRIVRSIMLKGATLQRPPFRYARAGRAHAVGDGDRGDRASGARWTDMPGRRRLDFPAGQAIKTASRHRKASLPARG